MTKLKRQFALDDDYLEDIVAKLTDAERVAMDEEGKVLVWIGDADAGQRQAVTKSMASAPSPGSDTPAHLAERILAEQAAMEDYVPVGHSTNLAARMEQIATPGSIVISEYTRKLTEGYFDLKALGAADIQGVEERLKSH